MQKERKEKKRWGEEELTLVLGSFKEKY
jgi:hypothetical protein